MVPVPLRWKTRIPNICRVLLKVYSSKNTVKHLTAPLVRGWVRRRAFRHYPWTHCTMYLPCTSLYNDDSTHISPPKCGLLLITTVLVTYASVESTSWLVDGGILWPKQRPHCLTKAHEHCNFDSLSLPNNGGPIRPKLVFILGTRSFSILVRPNHQHVHTCTTVVQHPTAGDEAQLVCHAKLSNRTEILTL